jgi:peptidoglycan/LPS O-acetylase OafA/YrhL
VGAIRLFLALAVAYDHLSQQHTSGLGAIPKAWLLGMNGPFSVLFFYMISGFLISFALSNKYGTTGHGLVQFYKSRFIRIFSLYWPLLLLMILDPSSRGWLSSASVIDKVTSITLVGMDWTSSFESYPNPIMVTVPVLGQAWTLGAELTFYIVAPFLLRSWKAAVIALIGSAVIRGTLVFSMGLHPVWSFSFFPSTLIFFMLGFYARAASARFLVLSNPALGTILVAVSFSVMALQSTGWDTGGFWVAILCFSAGLPGVFNWTKDQGLLNILGELSFPLYLTHEFVFVRGHPLIQFFTNHWGSLAGYSFAIVACLLFAQISHLLIEQPVANLMRRSFARYHAHHAGAAPGEL